MDGVVLVAALPTAEPFFRGATRLACRRAGVLSVDEVLAGPRGRGLCLAVALSLSETVSRAWEANADDLARAFRDLDATPVAAWVDPLAFLEPLDESVSSAMYWQEPHQVNVAAADRRSAIGDRRSGTESATSVAGCWRGTLGVLLSLTCLLEGPGRSQARQCQQPRRLPAGGTPPRRVERAL